jgi:hypothetical protein
VNLFHLDCSNLPVLIPSSVCRQLVAGKKRPLLCFTLATLINDSELTETTALAAADTLTSRNPNKQPSIPSREWQDRLVRSSALPLITSSLAHLISTLTPAPELSARICLLSFLPHRSLGRSIFGCSPNRAPSTTPSKSRCRTVTAKTGAASLQ